jgi:ParB-like chromosome segregation protein Spo0J
VTVESLPLDALDLSLGRVRCPPPARVEAIRQDLGRHGQLSPLVARLQPAGTPQLVDGFKRLRAARELGWSTLEVGSLEVAAETALALLLSLNRRFGLSPVEEALVVQELVRSGLNGVEVGRLLSRHKTWVSRRLGLLERLAPELQEELKLGLLDPGVARRLLPLPPGNQVEMAAVVRRAGLGVRATETLVSLWRRAPSEAARQFVVRHPEEALTAAGASPEPPVDPRLSSQGQCVQRRLRGTLRTLAHLAEALGSGPPSADRALLAEDLDSRRCPRHRPSRGRPELSRQPQARRGQATPTSPSRLGPSLPTPLARVTSRLLSNDSQTSRDYSSALHRTARELPEPRPLRLARSPTSRPSRRRSWRRGPRSLTRLHGALRARLHRPSPLGRSSVTSGQPLHSPRCTESLVGRVSRPNGATRSLLQGGHSGRRSGGVLYRRPHLEAELAGGSMKGLHGARADLKAACSIAPIVGPVGTRPEVSEEAIEGLVVAAVLALRVDGQQLEDELFACGGPNEEGAPDIRYAWRPGVTASAAS